MSRGRAQPGRGLLLSSGSAVSWLFPLYWTLFIAPKAHQVTAKDFSACLPCCGVSLLLLLFATLSAVINGITLGSVWFLFHSKVQYISYTPSTCITIILRFITPGKLCFSVSHSLVCLEIFLLHVSMIKSLLFFKTSFNFSSLPPLSTPL